MSYTVTEHNEKRGTKRDSLRNSTRQDFGERDNAVEYARSRARNSGSRVLVTTESDGAVIFDSYTDSF
jgi:hypothetical protein